MRVFVGLLFAAFAAFTPAVGLAQGGGSPPVPKSTSDSIRRPVADTVRKPVADTITRPAIPDSAFARRDSVNGSRIPPRDTLKSPLVRPYAPASTEIGAASWHWDRDAMYASGALTLGDLLATVPGVNLMRTGFIIAPQVAAWYGDPGRVRVFLDGVELDAINVRNGGVTDFAVVPMWSLEDVNIERSAGELRVHLRTVRTRSTTASTRADILTGTENLNLYRGFFGKRFDNGVMLQLLGQQQSSISRTGMDGASFGGMARIGWARGNWSVDGTLLHQSVDRNSGVRNVVTTPEINALPAFQGSENLTYLRAAWRDPQNDGPWAQLIAASISAGESRAKSSLLGAQQPSAAPTDTVDTMRVSTQYTLAAGITKWGLKLSSTNRFRSMQGKSTFSPGARVEYESKLLTVSAFGERGSDSTTRSDVQARFAPLSWFNVSGSVSRYAPNSGSSRLITAASRVEGALKWRDRWVGGGIITRGASTVAAPIELDTALRAVNVAASTGTIVTIRGPLLRGWSLDVDAINWAAADAYRPQTQARARLWFESSFLESFPRGNFHLSVAGTYEYRTAGYAPLGKNSIGQTTAGGSVISTLLEIRISTAVISWQYRNTTGTVYATYPGYVMPRLVNTYGVRWEFWN